MRSLSLVLVFLLAVSPSMAAGYSRPIRGSIEAIKKDIPKDGLPRLHGYRDGYPGYVGAYMRHFPKIYGNATMRDIELMLKDSNPVIRLVGAMLVINHELDPNLLRGLASDSTLLSVGPFLRDKEVFREMKVSEVLTEMQHDPRFQLRADLGQVRLDYIREKNPQRGSRIVLGNLPEYPFEMARAGINGEVTARILFNPDTAAPEIQIIKTSHREFSEALTWALSKWELKKSEPELPVSATTTEFECRVVFQATE